MKMDDTIELIGKAINEMRKSAIEVGGLASPFDGYNFALNIQSGEVVWDALIEARQTIEAVTDPDILQAVIAFRKTRDASVRYEAALPVLKWNLGDGWIYRVNNNRAEGWHPALKIWKPIVGSVDDGTRVILNCSDATASQIAASGCPLEDVPEPLRASVRKLREPGEAAPASESRPCCEAENTLRDLIQLYFRGPGFLSDVWQGQLHRKFELARESLAPRVDGRGKK